MQLQEEVNLLKSNVMKYKVFITYNQIYMHTKYLCSLVMYKVIVGHMLMYFISECFGKQEER